MCVLWGYTVIYCLNDFCHSENVLRTLRKDFIKMYLLRFTYTCVN